MKRAQRGIVLRSSFLQGNVFADNANDVSLQLEILREVGGERHAMVRKIVSQSGANGSIADGDCCGEAVGNVPSFQLRGNSVRR